MPNKLNISKKGVHFFFKGINIPFFRYNTVTEFDKMQIPYNGVILYRNPLYLVCLATTGLCVFGALTSVGALFYFKTVRLKT